METKELKKKFCAVWLILVKRPHHVPSDIAVAKHLLLNLSVKLDSTGEGKNQASLTCIFRATQVF